MTPTVLLGVGGGIAAYKAAALASRLVQDGYEVRVAMTPSARQFVGPLTFEGLVGSKAILTSTQVDPDGTAPHVTVTRNAGLMVIAPATADLLARLAAGLCDEPVGLCAVAVRCPVLLCPAMNDAMWENAVVQRNVRTLQELGFHFLGPEHGHLAEGYEAVGRMAEPERIAAEVARLCPST